MRLVARRVGWPLMVVALVLVGEAVLTGWLFSCDMQRARTHAAQGSVLIPTRCGQIEYQEAGTGVPLLAVHGSGGGHDQGMAFAGALAKQGIRVIAMSCFGYLRTPMPAWVEHAMMRMMRMISSDFLFWAALHVARDQVIKLVLATPPQVLTSASPQERTRVNTMLDISARVDRYGTYASAQYTANGIAGARFIGFDEGGHTWVGHNDEVMAEIVNLLNPTASANGA